MAPVALRTERLLLRPWRAEDRAPFAALNADPEVRRYFGGPQSRSDSDATVERIVEHFEQHGWGFWALEVRAEQRFIGFTGLAWTPFEASFTPAVEIGWRLERDAWGHGYATEAARAALGFAFGTLGLPEVVAFAVEGNLRSRAVMERLGMTHDPTDDFDHPALPDTSELRRHVLYRITPERFAESG